MPVDQPTIAHLNAQLKNELTAISQYFLHARMLEHWGFSKLGTVEYQESLGEMRHADSLVQRILMLDGLPNLQNLHPLGIGENVAEILASDRKLEQISQKTCKEGIASCEQHHDFVSRDLFVGILRDTETHLDWLESQLGLIERVGLQNYLQSQI